MLPQCLEDLSDVVEVLLPILDELVNDRSMSSRYTTTNELVNDYSMSSISLMKVAGAFVNLKGMTSHLKIPSLALQAVFNTLEGSIGT